MLDEDDKYEKFHINKFLYMTAVAYYYSVISVIYFLNSDAK